MRREVMTHEEILKAIQGNEYSKHDTEEPVEYIQGAYLYTALWIIDDIQHYCQVIVNNNLEGHIIGINDIFLFLYEKNIFRHNYSYVYDDINNRIVKEVYGQTIFYDDNKKFKELKKALEELYADFENIV